LTTPDIELTEPELELLAQIKFNHKSHSELHASLAPMDELTESLLNRRVVPDVRLLYFTDPERNPGARGKSRQQIFEQNGTSGDEIQAHPNFLKYLEYFVFGPKLPASVIKIFKEEAMLSGMLTYGDINYLAPKARAAVRSYNLTPHDAAEEFHKLALECGASPDGAANLRKSILSVRAR
jgi:hypothetical protein